MNLQIISLCTTIICPLIAIAFYTLLERKGLAYFQRRKGPNKVGLIGLPQPLLDALKLFTKEQVTPHSRNRWLFKLFPSLGLILALTIWRLYPSQLVSHTIPVSILIFILVSRLNVYATLGSGWSSNSKYALLGAVRAIAQTISYEVSISLILLTFLWVYKTIAIRDTIVKGALTPALIAPPLVIMWLITCLAESNRTPFDLVEGERELVSGFNVEYRGGLFALIFMAEYTNILFLRCLTAVIIFPNYGWVFLGGLSLALAWGFILVRGTLPRIRYDMLISLCWKVFLPAATVILIVIMPIRLL